MKICSKCKENKPKESFGKDTRHKDGLLSRCRSCENERNKTNSEYLKMWKLNNPEKVKAIQKFWTDTNTKKPITKEKRKIYKENQKISDLEKYKSVSNAASKKWNNLNPEKYRSIQATYRAKKRKAVTAWADSEKDAIQELYRNAKNKTKETGIKHHVDHIVPLNSKLVQGFHCLANLQVLEAKDNIAKGNRVWPDMPQ
jgi:hypothetical protein